MALMDLLKRMWQRINPWAGGERSSEPTDPEDGTDNDGDGIVDEGIVVLRLSAGEPNEYRVVLARGVARYLEGETPNGVDDNGNGQVDEKGLFMQVRNGAIYVNLTVQRMGRDRQPIFRTVRTAVAMRN